jgi:hypothetical protein
MGIVALLAERAAGDGRQKLRQQKERTWKGLTSNLCVESEKQPRQLKSDEDNRRLRTRFVSMRASPTDSGDELVAGEGNDGTHEIEFHALLTNGIHNARHLRGHDTEHFNGDTIEFVEATPRTGLTTP